jgi:hypothetical protein
MRAISKVFVLSSLVLGLSSTSAYSATIADWTFETSAPVTAGPIGPEMGAGSALGNHAGIATYSSPAGNGSSHSFSSNTWAVGDYYQFSVSTLGYAGISLSWDQTSSGTGPRDFQMAYSTNGTSFTNAATYSVLANAAPNAPWNVTTSSALYKYVFDLSSITGLNNQSSIYFRLIDNTTVSAGGGSVAAGGTDRVDNFIVSGNSSPVPLPAAIWLLSSGLTGLIGIGRKRKAA